MKNTLYDIIALGELLIDFAESGTGPQGNQLFEANPGGAPCNVLAMLSKLGKKTAFVGKVGKDQFGFMLKKALDDAGINSDHLIFDDEVHTTLAFVHNFPNGDRDFSFYRKPGADMMLDREDVEEEFIRSSKVFHFGTLSMTCEKAREATKKALRIAKENKLIITFDPNLRKPLWDSLNTAKEQMIFGLEQCTVLKIAEDELEFLTGTDCLADGVAILKERFSIPFILLTLGEKGSIAYYKDLCVKKESFLQKKTIDTTGAGDTFFASVINYILEHGMENLTEGDLREMLLFANAAASMITTVKGALKVMPDRYEIENFLKEYRF